MRHAPITEDSTSEFNARERAALALRLPDSGNPWLDEMIAKARHLDAATAIECAYIAVLGKDRDGLSMEPVEHLNGLASIASEMADALLDEVLTEPYLAQEVNGKLVKCEVYVPKVGDVVRVRERNSLFFWEGCKAKITKRDSSGEYWAEFGGLGNLPDSFVRDAAGRSIWCIGKPKDFTVLHRA